MNNKNNPSYLIQFITGRYIEQSPAFTDIHVDYIYRLELARRADYWNKK